MEKVIVKFRALLDAQSQLLLIHAKNLKKQEASKIFQGQEDEELSQCQ